MTQYTSAASSSVSSVRKLDCPIRCARHSSSWTLMIETSAESLIMAMNSLPIAGVTIRTACGSTIRRIVVRSRHARAPPPPPSWPRGTAWMPARKISVMYAP